MLPLQWFSVLVEWIETLFLAMHPSSSNYCMIIFSPTTIGWKLHFILSKKGWLVVLPLQLYSVLMEWIKIPFLAMHPSSLYYCMPIFSPTTIGWKLHFVLSFWWLFFSLHSFIFPRVRHYYFNLWLQLAIFLPRGSLLLILAMATIFLFFASAILLSFCFYYIVHCCLHGLKQSLLFPRHMIELIGYLLRWSYFSMCTDAWKSWSNQVLFAHSYLIFIHTACDGNNLHHFIDALGFGEWIPYDDHLLDLHVVQWDTLFTPCIFTTKAGPPSVMEPIQKKFIVSCRSLLF